MHTQTTPEGNPRSRSAIAITLALFAAGALVLGGCRVTLGPGHVATSYYTPLYYQGYVVYYDEVGRPVYYANGARYYIPAGYVDYGRYAAHYRTHRVHYNRWYRSRGHRYRRYRRKQARTHRRQHRTTRRNDRRRRRR